MFEVELPDPEALRHADDATVVAAIEEWNRVEAAAGARRLAAIAELADRRCGKDDERAYYACDFWDSAAAEVAAALEISHGKASSQMNLGLALRDRLPRVGALYLDGKVSARVVSAIAWHTLLVTDEALEAIDAALAAQADRWGRLSEYKLAQSIDFWVGRHDPAALRRARTRARDRSLQVGDKDDESDTTSVFGRLYATDAAMLDRRLAELAQGVCDDDPRTIAQRRADALGALAAGASRLACRCADPDCPAGGNDGRASAVVIHMVAEAAALGVQPDPQMNGEWSPENDPENDPEPKPDPDASVPTPTTPPAPIADPAPGAGLLGRGGIVPTPLLAELIRSGATVRHVRLPDVEPEPRYRPSARLEQFVRVRDLTCRFPGCHEPAEFCDLDHTIPYPLGPTHPSNIKCLCRKHHLLKTFWTGIGGWADQQLPDGTVIWTSPSGRRYKTVPGSRLFFPAWNVTTAELPPPPAAGGMPTNRAVMMPRRRRTRAADRAQRIRQERALNAPLVVERNEPPPF